MTGRRLLIRFEQGEHIPEFDDQHASILEMAQPLVPGIQLISTMSARGIEVGDQSIALARYTVNEIGTVGMLTTLALVGTQVASAELLGAAVTVVGPVTPEQLEECERACNEAGGSVSCEGADDPEMYSRIVAGQVVTLARLGLGVRTPPNFDSRQSAPVAKAEIRTYESPIMKDWPR